MTYMRITGPALSRKSFCFGVRTNGYLRNKISVSLTKKKKKKINLIICLPVVNE